MGTLLGIAAVVPLGAAVFGGLTVFVAMRYLATGRKGPFPVRVDLGQFRKLREAAEAGNRPMMIDAVRKAFELDLASSPLTDIIAEWARFEVQRNAKDPTKSMFVIDGIAKFTGLTREEVLPVVLEDFTPKPAVSPAVPVVAAALLLLLPGVASAASPQMTWGMPVKGPQRFYESAPALRSDPPLMRNQHGQLVSFTPVNHAGDALVGLNTLPVQPPEGSYYQPVYYHNGTAFMQRGPVRRWIANRQPVRRVGRAAGRVILAPFRFLFRRGRR